MADINWDFVLEPETLANNEAQAIDESKALLKIHKVGPSFSH
jgi:hypothetical protein